MACLDDNTAVEFASGNLGKSAMSRVEAHLATCRECRTLVAALAVAPGDPDSDVITSPRHVARGKAGRHHNAAALSPTAPQGSEPRRAAEPVVVGGDTIGRYIVLRRLGAGGMGVVYAAYDPQLDRKVALKLLRTGIGLGEPEARARLVREAQAIAQLSHPNVVAVYDVGTAVDGAVYVAMEFVEGDTLTQWLTRWDRGWRDILEIFREAGRGLSAAHAVGLLHRDFKPDNVLVGADSRVRVTDFGLARSLVTGSSEELGSQPGPELSALRVTLTATGAVMGTPRYMAPEQLRGGDVGAAADQFSFCVALYEALYGCHPVPGNTAAKMIEEGARVQLPPDDGKVPAWIAPILLRGLDIQPQKRFPSMAALLIELAPPLATQRRRGYVALIGAAALVLGGAAAATVLVPGSSSSNTETKLAVLTEQIQELLDEREHLLTQLEDLRRQGQADQERLKDVITKLAEKTAKISELEDQVRTLAGDAAPPVAVVTPRKPPLRPEGGVAEQALKKAMTASSKKEIEGCMLELLDRHPTTDLVGLTVRFSVLPQGRVQQSSATGGMDDNIVSECVTMAIRRIAWPTSPDVTVAEAQIRVLGGEVQVGIHRLGTEPAPPHIDTP